MDIKQMHYAFKNKNRSLKKIVNIKFFFEVLNSLMTRNITFHNPVFIFMLKKLNKRNISFI